MARIAGQILALCIASHHSGLIDCISLTAGKPAEDLFTKRMNKAAEKTHLQEVLQKADRELLASGRSLLMRPEISQAFQSWIERIFHKTSGDTHSQKAQSPIYHQQIGLLARSLFSCLIDADRIDTADFEHPGRARRRLRGTYESWETLIERLDARLDSFALHHPIDALRQDISRHCLEGATRNKGIYTLTVPTGGGKTLASLRFAMHHARKHALDRIIYVIPFTSIIDQNAEVVRRIFGARGCRAG